MDYKELIGRIRDFLEFAVAIEEDKLFTAFQDAATAIETLLAERDAAVEDITEILKTPEENQCQFCVWDGKCPEEFYSCATNAAWRGPTKGDAK